MTALQPIKGTDVGLTGADQVHIALSAIAERGGVAQTRDIYTAMEAVLNPKGYTLCKQGKDSLRFFVNTVAVKKNYLYPSDKTSPGWRLTPHGREFLSTTGTKPAETTINLVQQENPELSEQRELVEVEGYFDAANIEEARRRVTVSIVQRQGQAEFRRKLLEAYNYQCPVTGCNAESALEAAHIIPYKGVETNYTSNGLPLRADVHILFDLHLLSIHPQTRKVVISPELLTTSYIKYRDQPVSLPEHVAAQPDLVALAKHHALFLKKCSPSLLKLPNNLDAAD